VIRDLPDSVDPKAFGQYLLENKISLTPSYHIGEAVFSIANWEDADLFLELVGGAYKGKKIVLSVQKSDYKPLSVKWTENHVEEAKNMKDFVKNQ
jgi:hypothetical protein